MSLEAHTVTAQAMDAGDRSEWSVVVIHGPDAATNGRTIPLQALVTGISRSRNSASTDRGFGAPFSRIRR
jgi:hypothetical protein